MYSCIKINLKTTVIPNFIKFFLKTLTLVLVMDVMDNFLFVQIQQHRIYCLSQRPVNINVWRKFPCCIIFQYYRKFHFTLKINFFFKHKKHCTTTITNYNYSKLEQKMYLLGVNTNYSNFQWNDCYSLFSVIFSQGPRWYKCMWVWHFTDSVPDMFGTRQCNY